MEISIKKALKNVASENYDKTNILFYFVLLFISGLLGSVMEYCKNSKSFGLFGIVFIFIVLITILSVGVVTLATNNAFKRKKGVFPSLTNDFSKVLKNGFLYCTGSSLTVMVMIIPITILMAVLMFINPLLGLLTIIPSFYLAYIFFGLYFNFLATLSFKSWFDYKKALQTLNRSKGAFGKCVLRLFGLQLLASFITFVLIFIIAFTCGFGSAIAGQQSDNNTTLLMIVSTISSLIAVFIFGISAVYSVDISAQYLRSVFVKKKPKPIVNNQ